MTPPNATANAPKKRVSLNPEISLGHIMQALVLLLGGVGVYYNLDKRVVVLENDNPAQNDAKDDVIELKTRLDMMAAQNQRDQTDLKNSLIRIEDKVDRIAREK